MRKLLPREEKNLYGVYLVSLAMTLGRIKRVNSRERHKTLYEPLSIIKNAQDRLKGICPGVVYILF